MPSGGNDDLPDNLPEDQVPGESANTAAQSAGGVMDDDDDRPGAAEPPPATDSASAYAHGTTKQTGGASAPPPTGPTGLEPAPAVPAGRRTLVLVAILAAGLLLYVGKPILLPLAVAVLLSFLLSPMCEWMERRYVPRVASVIIVITAAFILLIALGWAVFNGVQELGRNVEYIADNIEQKVDNLPFRSDEGTIVKAQKALERLEDTDDALSGDEEEALEPDPATSPATQEAQPAQQQPPPAELATADGTSTETQAQPATRPTTQPVRGSEDSPLYVTIVEAMSPLERTGYFLGLLATPIASAGLVIIFALFILLQRDDLRDRVIKLAAGQQLNLATQAIDDAATRISKYLVAMAIVNGTYGLAVGIGLEVIAFVLTGGHFPSIWLWALLCAALRFIPYLGPWMAAAFPIFVSIGYYPGYEMFLATAGYFVVIELLSNNVMEPMLYGSTTGMSPVAVILAATFWTFVWGPVGLLVATPLTTCLVVLGKYVPALRFFDTLLGDEPVLSPDSRLYQRMLALDAEDAEDVVEEYREEHSLTETFDNVLLPALTLAERDRHAGHLTAERIDFIRIAMREIVEELSRQEEPIPSDSIDLNEPAEARISSSAQASLPVIPRVVVIPSVDAADETAALMVKALLDRRGFEVTVVDDEELTSEKLEQVFSLRADVAVISAVPPRAVARARYLVKRLKMAQAQRSDHASAAAATIVGLWTVQYDTQRAKNRVRAGDGMDLRIVTSLAEAVEEVRQRAQVVAARRASEQEGAKTGSGVRRSPTSAAGSGPARPS